MIGYMYTVCPPSHPNMAFNEPLDLERALKVLVAKLSGSGVPFHFGTLRWCITPVDRDDVFITLVTDRPGTRLILCKWSVDVAHLRRYVEVEPVITPEMAGWSWHLMRLDL